MTRIRIDCFSLSLDGYGAGVEQSLEAPMGRGGMGLHGWALASHSFRATHGMAGGLTGVDDGFAAAGMANLGAWVIGRNMFGPVRGPWPDDSWRGWWGDDPPYHCDVFVLTNHPRPTLVMAGGTRFHFVGGDLGTVLARAATAAQGRDVRVGGGVATARAAIRAGLVDRMHLAISPVMLGEGEAFWTGLDLAALGYAPPEVTQGEAAMHLVITRV